MGTARFRDPRVRVLAAVALVIVLLVADAVYASVRFRSTFQSAACDLKKAARGLERFDVEGADSRLIKALEEIEAARDYLSHPAMRVAGLLPFLDDDLAVLEALTDVARDAALSGRVGTDVASDLGLSEGSSLGAVYSDGRVDLAALTDASRSVSEARSYLESARTTLRAAPDATIGRVRAARGSAASLIAEALGSLEDTAIVLQDLPSILGGDGPRTYFLAFQAPSEARGGGGLIGVYGLLRADDGHVEMLKVAPIRDLVPKLKRGVSGPAWFEDLYGGLDGLGGWREANSSPTFPTSSRILLKMYESATGDNLDGVIAMDPVVVANLLEGTGSISAAGYPHEVNASNAGRILMRDIYVDFAGMEDEQNRFLRDLVDQIWKRLGAGKIDAQPLSEAVAASVAAGRLKFYSTASEEQDSVEVAGLSGDPRDHGPDTQMIFHNNFAANKIDWYLHRSQSTTISIDEDGNGRVVTVMQVENQAPRGERSLLKKSDVNELPSGLNLMSLHMMLPQGAEVNEVYSGTTPIEYFEGLEGGMFPTVWTPLQLAVGARARVSVSYSVPNLVDFSNGRGRFEMTFLPQGLVRPDTFELSVSVPEGYQIGSGDDGRLLRSGPLERTRTVKARISAPGTPHKQNADPLSEVCN